MMSSRDTEGYSTSSSSTLSPFASMRTIWWTGIRVPFTHACPWQIFALMEIRSNGTFIASKTSLFQRASLAAADARHGLRSLANGAYRGNSSFETYKGVYDISMPRDSKFDLHADVGRHGEVKSAFSMMMPAGGRSGKTFHAAVNGGGPLLTLKGYRGDFRIN